MEWHHDTPESSNRDKLDQIEVRSIDQYITNIVREPAQDLMPLPYDSAIVLDPSYYYHRSDFYLNPFR